MRRYHVRKSFIWIAVWFAQVYTFARIHDVISGFWTVHMRVVQVIPFGRSVCDLIHGDVCSIVLQ